MKILLITESLGSGGAERQLTELAVLLKIYGYQIKFITYVDRPFYHPFLLENRIDHELVSEAQNKYTRLYYLYKKIKKIEPDVVISFLPSVNITTCLLRLIGCKSKLIVSERSHTETLDLRRRMTFNLYRLADYVVTNSITEAENICNFAPFLAGKLRVITNTVDTDKFTPALVPPSGFVHIVSVGRVIPVKNIVNYLHALKNVIDLGYNFHATWVGDAYDRDYYRKCLDQRDRLGLDGIFEFKSATNDISTVYQSGDILCLPSLYEGFPNVICEAMSCGLPIVCSNVCDNPEIVDAQVGFLFAPKDIEDMTQSLLKCLSLSESERRLLGANGRARAINVFSKDRYVESYINIMTR